MPRPGRGYSPVVPTQDPHAAPPVDRVLETVIYGPDLPRLCAFYRNVIGLRLVSDNSPRGVAFRISPSAMLLVFQSDLARVSPGGIPAHGADGPGHMALGVPAGALARWRDHLAAGGVPVEHEHEWPNGARSIYVRDPAGNSLEFIEGDLWPD